MSVAQNELGNKLLRALSPHSFARLAKFLTFRQLPQGLEIGKPGVAGTTVVFPETGVASVIGNTDAKWQELGLFGNEGAAGLSGVFTSHPSLNLVVMQVAGNGFEIDTGVLKDALERNGEIREILLAYVSAFIVQISCTAIANVQCNVSQRLARWLLMVQDRVSSDRLALTHDYIAAMLGIGRTSVTLSLMQLEQAGLITTGRKLVRIESRSELSALAGRYYGVPEEQYARIMEARTHRYQPD